MTLDDCFCLGLYIWELFKITISIGKTMIKVGFHFLGVNMKCCRERNKCKLYENHVVAIRQVAENIKNLKYENSVSFELSFAYEHCPAGVKAKIFLLSYRSGNDFCQQL